MGQQAAAFATWRGQNRRISLASCEAMGQQSRPNKQKRSPETKPEKSKSHFALNAHKTLENQWANAKLFAI
jgi:hypothetical protein